LMAVSHYIYAAVQPTPTFVESHVGDCVERAFAFSGWASKRPRYDERHLLPALLRRSPRLLMLPISIVIPCYNAAATLARTHAR
jgi:hypothetical protein